MPVPTENVWRYTEAVDPMPEIFDGSVAPKRFCRQHKFPFYLADYCIDPYVEVRIRPRKGREMVVYLNIHRWPLVEQRRRIALWGTNDKRAKGLLHRAHL